MKSKKKTGIKRVLCWLRNLILILFGLSLFMVFFYKFIPVYITPLMLARSVGQLIDGEKVRMEHTWMPIEEISPELVQAVVASEDNLFMQHNGFDVQQIRKALDEHKEGGRQRGASTISQQTAKNVFLLPTHSFVRKGLEAYFTVLIEWIWGKERIMEVYLNSIEMGNGIYGAEKTAQLNFSKPAKKLNAREAALIAATLPNPRRFNSARPSSYILKRQTRIQDLMNKIGPIGLKSEKRKVKNKK